MAWKQSITLTAEQLAKDDETETEAEIRATVTLLCQALLQLEQSVEKRFLRTPLGEAQNTPGKKRSRPAVVAASSGASYQVKIIIHSNRIYLIVWKIVNIKGGMMTILHLIFPVFNLFL